MNLNFVSELPPSHTNKGQQNYDELVANAGRWAEWWGTYQTVHSGARRVRRAGFEFEAAIRNGKPYIRAVRIEDET